MKTFLLFIALLFIGCTPDEIPTKQVYKPTCYTIITWTDSPDGDSITIEIAPYNQQVFKVKDYRDYLNKKQICNLSTIK